MADARLIPDGIRDESTIAFNELIDRLQTIDLAPLLIYIIDGVASSALPHLAEQFHITGEGWQLSTDDADRRAWLKRAIDLHRYKGTVWAIKEAVRAAGYTDVEVIERITHWAMFRVRIGIAEGTAVAQVAYEQLIGLILSYKNARSHLLDVQFATTSQDSMPAFSDQPGMIGVQFPTSDTACRTGMYCGGWTYNGVHTHDPDDNLWSGVVGWIGSDTRTGMSATYDGTFPYIGFTYSGTASFPIDAAVTMTIVRHGTYDGRYNYDGSIGSSTEVFG